MQRARQVAEEIFLALPSLQGEEIVPKNAYEKALCEKLGWTVFDNRYYDAFNGQSFIEIKKGQAGMHFDMVRYAEVLLGHGPEDTLTVFFRWKKKEKQITEAYIIDTKELIEFLRINKQFAQLYLQVKAQVPRGVNILASATAKDLREMACFSVNREGIFERQRISNAAPRPSSTNRKWTQQSIQHFLKQKRKSEDRRSILYYLF